jgi:hypothetical protein
MKELIEIVYDSFGRGDPTGLVCGSGVWSQAGKVEVSRQPARYVRGLRLPGMSPYPGRLFEVSQRSDATPTNRKCSGTQNRKGSKPL